MKIFLVVYIFVCLLCVLHTKLFLVEVGDYQAKSVSKAGEIAKENKEKVEMVKDTETDRQEDNAKVNIEAGSDYVDIVYDEAEYDGEDYDQDTDEYKDAYDDQ